VAFFIEQTGVIISILKTRKALLLSIPITLLLSEALNNICEQINGKQKESTKNDNKIQESPAGSTTDSTNSSTEESHNQNLNYIETQLLLSINNIRAQNGLQMLSPNQTLIGKEFEAGKYNSFKL